MCSSDLHDHWGVLTLFLVIVIDSSVKHTMFYDVDGWVAYSLLFLLPTCPIVFSSNQDRLQHP